MIGVKFLSGDVKCVTVRVSQPGLADRQQYHCSDSEYRAISPHGQSYSANKNYITFLYFIMTRKIISLL